MADLNIKNSYPVMGISIEKLKPKRVRKNIELTLWERLYIFEIITGNVHHDKTFFYAPVRVCLSSQG